MRTRIILQLATVLVLLLGTSTNGLFFSYPKNALVQFFQSLHPKKELKRQQSVHHYHLHYYPVRSQTWTKPVKAPEKVELEKLHSNHLESLGWNDNEYSLVPEPILYRPPPLQDPWPDGGLNRPWSWEDNAPEQSTGQSVKQEPEIPKSGIIVQVPLHQNIIVQQPPAKEEKPPPPHPWVSFFEKLRRIKNSIFCDRVDDKSDEMDSEPKPNVNDKLNAFVVYFRPEIGRKL